MASVYGGILLALFAICIITAGCISDDESLPVPVSANSAEPGVMIQTSGDVTGQGVILEGVPRGTIDTITFTIGLAPGFNTLDLSTMTIVYADAVRTEILTPVDGYRGNPPQGYWGIVGTANELGNPNLRMEYNEQFTIRINPKAPVVPNQVITVSVKPGEGKPLIFRRIAPSSIAENDNILATL
jgi:archaellin